MKLTSLTLANGIIPTKHFHCKNGVVKTIGYPLVKYWNHGLMHFASIHDFHAHDFSGSILIRGAAIDSLQQDARRITENFPDKGTDWLMIDIDSHPIPEQLSPYSIETIKWFIKNYLPTEFNNVTCSVQFSGSAGIIDRGTNMPLKQGLNVHLFYALDKPVCNKQVKEWLRGSPVDSSLYTSVQPHYVSDPIIGDGVECILPERRLLIEGKTDIISVPEITYDNNSKTGTHEPWKEAKQRPNFNDLLYCRFIREFIKKPPKDGERRYESYRAFAHSIYRIEQGEKLTQAALNGYEHEDAVLRSACSGKPIKCTTIVESTNFNCKHLNDNGMCELSISATSPYGLASYIGCHR